MAYAIDILAGCVLGFLSGMGIGGGSLLLLWLTLVRGISREIATRINLLFFVPSALIACLFRVRQGMLPWKRVLPAMAAGCISAALFSQLGTVLDETLLRKLFGGLLLLTGLRELFYKPKKADA